MLQNENFWQGVIVSIVCAMLMIISLFIGFNAGQASIWREAVEKGYAEKIETGDVPSYKWNEE